MLDLLRSAVRENLRVMKIPGVNPDKLEACRDAVEACMSGMRACFEKETATPRDCARVVRVMEEVKANLSEIRLRAERETGKLMDEEEMRWSNQINT
jgi:hypothetical protein